MPCCHKPDGWSTVPFSNNEFAQPRQAQATLLLATQFVQLEACAKPETQENAGQDGIKKGRVSDVEGDS